MCTPDSERMPPPQPAVASSVLRSMGALSISQRDHRAAREATPCTPFATGDNGERLGGDGRSRTLMPEAMQTYSHHDKHLKEMRTIASTWGIAPHTQINNAANTFQPILTRPTTQCHSI